MQVPPDWSPNPSWERSPAGRLDRLKQSDTDSGAAHTHSGVHLSLPALLGKGMLVLKPQPASPFLPGQC